MPPMGLPRPVANPQQVQMPMNPGIAMPRPIAQVPNMQASAGMMPMQVPPQQNPQMMNFLRARMGMSY